MQCGHTLRKIGQNTGAFSPSFCFGRAIMRKHGNSGNVASVGAAAATQLATGAEIFMAAFSDAPRVQGQPSRLAACARSCKQRLPLPAWWGQEESTARRHKARAKGDSAASACRPFMGSSSATPAASASGSSGPLDTNFRYHTGAIQPLPAGGRTLRKSRPVTAAVVAGVPRASLQCHPFPLGSPNRAHTGQPRRACPPSSRAKAHVGLARRPIAATGGILEVHSWPPPRQAQSQASAGDGSPDRPTWNPGSRGETPQAAPGDNAEQQLLASTGPTRLKGQWGHRRDAGPRSGPH